jgi:hypothetical protein
MKIIRSSLLSRHAGIVAGMSTRIDGTVFGFNMSYNVGDDPAAVTENRKAFFDMLNIDVNSVAYPLQEHTATVAVCSSPQRVPSCDGLITAEKDLFLAVTIADCTPVLLYDARKKVIAGIHAGWRGTTQHIVGNAMTVMQSSFNTDPKDIVAFIGPSAGLCCYEVGDEVAQLFPPSCVRPSLNGKSHVDVKRANLLQLIEYGLQESHIEVNSDCSIHNQNYHSHRRDGSHSGRMLAVIGMKK